MRTKVLATRFLPARLPIYPTITGWLALDHWHAPSWMYGAAVCLAVIVWAIMIYAMAVQVPVDLNGDQV